LVVQLVPLEPLALFRRHLRLGFVRHEASSTGSLVGQADDDPRSISVAASSAVEAGGLSSRTRPLLKGYLAPPYTTTEMSDVGTGNLSPFDRWAVARTMNPATTTTSKTQRRIPAIVTNASADRFRPLA